MSNSVYSVFENLLSQPIPDPTEDDLAAVGAKVLTLRPNKELRYYLEKRSEQLGGMSLNALMLCILEDYRIQEQRAFADKRDSNKGAD